ncbi:MAG: ChbG/HpnK family deacetylase [Burkholderiales bacterium]|nr:MAG: ChbG/HpnK family deacetylase [Burkholderiales bacterium]
MSSMPRSLCICVDDYGLHEGINDAAISLAQMGRVHAISCMTAGLTWRTQAQRLIPIAACGVDIGLHLDFTEKLPGQVKRWPLGKFIALSYFRQLGRAAIRAEIIRQLDCFEQYFCNAPTYVDGHQHVHQLPIVREELLAQLALRYPTKRPWLRNTRSVGLDWQAAGEGWRAVVKPWGIALLGSRGLSAQALKQGHAQNQRLLGVYDFSGGAARYMQLLQKWFKQAQTGDLLMSHPSGQANAVDTLLPARQAEFSVLASEAFQQLLVHENIELKAVSRMRL